MRQVANNFEINSMWQVFVTIQKSFSEMIIIVM